MAYCQKMKERLGDCKTGRLGARVYKVKNNLFWERKFNE
jgi:hypothetical protein